MTAELLHGVDGPAVLGGGVGRGGDSTWERGDEFLGGGLVNLGQNELT